MNKRPSRGQVWRAKNTGKEVVIKAVENGFVFHGPHQRMGNVGRHEASGFYKYYDYVKG
jgi:hypothetical protein